MLLVASLLKSLFDQELTNFETVNSDREGAVGVTQ